MLEGNLDNNHMRERTRREKNARNFKVEKVAISRF